MCLGQERKDQEGKERERNPGIHEDGFIFKAEQVALL